MVVGIGLLWRTHMGCQTEHLHKASAWSLLPDWFGILHSAVAGRPQEQISQGVRHFLDLDLKVAELL